MVRGAEESREQLGADAVCCDHKCVGYTEHPEGGLVSVHFKDKPDVTAHLVVGADGVRSAIRAALLPQDPGPRYLGAMAWNANLYNPGGSVVDHGASRQGQIWVPGHPNTAWEKPQLAAFVSDAGGGYTYWGLRTLSEKPSYTSPDGGGMGRPGVKARCRQLCEEAGFTVPLAVLEAIPESDIFERALVDRVPLDELGGRMSSPSHRVVLLGDAAHAMSPAAGQGGRMAFEDVHTLLLAMDAHAEGGVLQLDAASLAPVVQQYERARLSRTSRLQRYCAEALGMASTREAATPQDLPRATQVQRMAELQKWLSQYPDNPNGDPNSQFWKPL